MPTVDFFLVTATDSLRHLHYESALRTFWGVREYDLNLHVIPWLELARADGAISSLTSLEQPHGVLRIDSPSGDQATVNELIRAGVRHTGVRHPPLMQRPEEIPCPRLVFHGLQRVLTRMQDCLSAHADLQPVVQPAHLLPPFDKNQSLDLLEAEGIPCAPRLMTSAATLPDDMQKHGCSQAYVKLAYGACGSGILLFDQSGDAPFGLTTVVNHKGRYCNSGRLKRIDGTKLVDTLNWLFAQHVTVQEAVDKSRVGGENFDVRFVVIHGEVCATVFRVSRNPVTNLHLGGWRGDVEQCRGRIPRRQWLDAHDAAVRAAELLSLSVCGVDVAFDRRTGQPFLLEVNSFGDFFPNWTDEQGRTIHECEIEATARSLGLL